MQVRRQRNGPPGAAATAGEWLAAGVRRHQAGQLAEAAELYQRVLAADPEQADALHLLGVIAHQRGDHAGAAALIRRAIAANGRVADFYSNLGLCLQAGGDLEGAVAAFRRAVALKPAYPEAWNNLGLVLRTQGQPEDGRTAFERAIALKPDYAQACSNLGNLLLALRDDAGALAAHKRAVALAPSQAEFRNNLGSAQKRLGQLDEAEASFRAAIECRPDLADAHINLGVMLQERGELTAALDCFRRALDRRPEHPAALNNMGLALKELGRLGEADAALRQALAAAPRFAVARSNLGNVLRESGAIDAAEAEQRAALALDPADAEIHRALLLTMAYNPVHDNAALFAEQRCFAAAHGRAPAGEPGLGNAPDPDRRLRVAFVSGDMRRHPVAINIEPLLRGRDRGRLETAVYTDVRRPDAMTAHLRALADHWQDIHGWSDATLAGRLRRDGTDVLVVLAGRFDDNRLALLAHRSAPVQVSIHDATSSAMPAADAWLTDGFIHPADTTEHFSERLVRLPHFYVYPPNADAPPVAPPPLRRNGRITFGSFNNPAKLAAPTLALWARVLGAVPGSRLLLKYGRLFGDPAVRERVAAAFAAAGIGADRVEFAAGDDTRAEHLARYADIDIALDPLHFNGATTTFEALWMGLPTVTLPGDRFVSRAAGSILATAGLDQCIAEDADDFVRRVAALAGDADGLAALRAGLRDRVATSPLCDAELYARNIEAALRGLWQDWCQRAAWRPKET